MKIGITSIKSRLISWKENVSGFPKKLKKFVACRGDKTQLIQVTYQIEPGNRERELNGLIEASQSIHSKEGYILTFNEEDEQMANDLKIKIIPVWKWLLGENG